MYTVVAHDMSASVAFDTTPSNGVDSGAATGWSISNNYVFDNGGTGAWSHTFSGESLRIAIKGTAVGADTTPQVTDTAGPTLTIATIEEDGFVIFLEFSEDIDRTTAGLPPASAFRITIGADGTPFAPTAVTAPDADADDNSLRLTSGTRIQKDQTVTLTYTDPTTGVDDTAAIQDLHGNDADFFTKSLTNNSTYDPPTFTSGRVTENGWGIFLDFSKDIDRTAAGLPRRAPFGSR